MPLSKEKDALRKREARKRNCGMKEREREARKRKSSNPDSRALNNKRIKKWREGESGKKKAADQKEDKSKKRAAKQNNDMQPFDLTSVPPDIDFSNFEQSPELAVLLFHLNSGHGRFSNLNRLREEEPDNEIMDKLIDEVLKHTMSEQEQQDMISRYYQAIGRGGFPNTSHEIKGFAVDTQDAMILSCGSCGIKDVQRAKLYCRVELKNLPSCFHFTVEQMRNLELEKNKPPIFIPTNEQGNFLPVWVYKLRSFYESEYLHKVFHLHPEFVDITTNGVEQTFFCENCYHHSFELKQKAAPPRSVASGLDFGCFQRIGLPKLSFAEKCIVARTRLYHHIVKIQNNHSICSRSDNTQNKLRGHCITFPHAAPLVMSLAILLRSIDRKQALINSLKGMVSLCYVGVKNEVDYIAKNAKLTRLFHVDAASCYAWLKVLKAVHPKYSDDPELPVFDEYLIRDFKAMEQEMFSNALKETDPLVLQQEMDAGDDVATVRTSTDLQSQQFDRSEQQQSDQSKEDIILLHSVVTDSDGAMITEDSTEDEDVELQLSSIRHIARLCNVDVRQRLQKWKTTAAASSDPLPIRREQDPSNEFAELGNILSTSFPDIFMFGVAPDNIKKASIVHLLLQWTNLASTDKSLLFYLFDVQRRFSVVRNMAAKIKNDTSAFQKFAEVVDSSEFKELIVEAADNPTSGASKKVIQTIRPMLSFGSHSLPFGSFNGTGLISRAMAMFTRYGPPTTFLTISPDDINNPTSFRLSITPRNNITFPSSFDSSQFNKVQNSEPIEIGTVNIPTDYTARKLQATSNPVAVALEFQALLSVLFSVIVGRKLDYDPLHDSYLKKTWYCDDTKSEVSSKGIFGITLGYIAAIETQQRGALHLHALIWGGLSPTLLESSAGQTRMIKTIKNVLDSMYCAEFPREEHIKQFLLRQMRQKRADKSLFPPLPIHQALLIPPVPSHMEDWNIRFVQYQQQCCIHEHTFTCKRSGCNYCRLAKPSGLINETKPTQLVLAKHMSQQDSNQDYIIDTTIRSKRESLKDLILHAAATSQPRVSIWELRRRELDLLSVPKESNLIIKHICSSVPLDFQSSAETWLKQISPEEVVSCFDALNSYLKKGNGYVVETNKLLALMTGSSSNASFLGSTEQAKIATFYLAKYMGKSKADIDGCITVLAAAQKYCTKYPSIAADTSTSKRNIQHLLTRFINQMHLKMEISDTQAALSLLGTGTEVCSDTFVYIATDSLIHFLNEELMKTFVMTEELKTSLVNESPNNVEEHQSTSMPDSKAASSESSILQQGDDIDYNVAFENAQQLLFGRKTNKTFGTALLYNVQSTDNKDSRTIVVNKPTHYRYRGIELANMTPFEYFSLIKIVPNSFTGIDEQDESAMEAHKGRLKSKMFPFGSGHPLCGYYSQVLLSKQSTPILFGVTPKLPASVSQFRNKKAWVSAMNEYAMYCMTIFKPWYDLYDDTCTAVDAHNFQYQALLEYIDALENSTTVIDNMRLKAMTTKMISLKTNTAFRSIINQYRLRNVDYWADKDLPGRPIPNKNREPGLNIHDEDDDYEQLEYEPLPQAAQTRAKNEITYIFHHMANIKNLFSVAPLSTSTNHEHDPETKFFLEIDVNFHCSSVQSFVPTASFDDSADNIPQVARQIEDDVLMQFWHDHKFTTSQREVLNAIESYFMQLGPLDNRATPAPNAPFILLTGDPGTGKSYVIDCICEMATLMQVGHVCTTSFNGLAAMNVDGTTICQLLSIRIDSRNPELKEESLANVRQNIKHNEICLFLVDEISTLDLTTVTLIDKRLRAAMNKIDVMFGGIATIFVGDFNQLPAVRKTFMLQDLIHNIQRPHYRSFQIGSSLNHAFQLFQQVQRYHLKQQNRSDDLQHMELLKQMSNGENVRIMDIAQYKALSTHDLITHPNSWLFAPILVATNAEKICIIDHQVQLFALHHKTVPFKWHSKVLEWRNRPSQKTLSAIESNIPYLFEYFVSGASGYLTLNINTNLGLVNGTPIIYHSLIASTPNDSVMIENAINNEAQIGQFVLLEEPPSAIVVQIIEQFEHRPITLRRQQQLNYLRSLRINQDDKTSDIYLAIAPTSFYGKTSLSAKSYRFYTGCNMVSQAKVLEHFPLELGFAMTVHKAQGRTIPNVILALSGRPYSQMTYAAIYVAISRVRKREDIRLLKIPTMSDNEAYRYIEKLNRNEFISYFDAGFHEYSGKWNYLDSLTASQTHLPK